MPKPTCRLLPSVTWSSLVLKAQSFEVDLNTGQTVGSDSVIQAYFALAESKVPTKALVIFFFVTLAVFVVGAAYFVFAWRTVFTRKKRRGFSKFEQPLVESEYPLVESEGVIA